MYGLRQLKKGIKDPHLFLRELNRLYHDVASSGSYNGAGVNIFEKNWDNLIVLDACRYDVFCERTDFAGTTERTESRAAATAEFVRANFSGLQLHDTICVTGNSWYHRLKDEIGLEFFHIEYPDEVEGDPDAKIRRMTERAITLSEEYPNKRLLVHFIPPHHPYAGPTADTELPNYDKQAVDFFDRIRRGEVAITDELLAQVYKENLDRVDSNVTNLLETLPGKSVVTADHGEMLGERSYPIPVAEYGHFSRLYTRELTEVPWHVHNQGERREIIASEPIESKEVADEVVDERLRNLGYKL